MQRLQDLFDPQQLKAISDAPQFLGTRHPTWFPLFHEHPRAIDYLVHTSIRNISLQGSGDVWLRGLTSRLLDMEDISNSSSSLAEIRAYGGFLEAGFSVTPISRSDNITPDFNINGGDGVVTVEVFAKHQDKKQDTFINAINSIDTSLPVGIERKIQIVGNTTITTTITELTPAGRPNPDNPYDSIQANMISRVCATKKGEKQIPDDHPSLLVMDFAHFGGPVVSEFLKSGQAAPIESGHRGITSGSIWYAMYGWKGAPIFEDSLHCHVRMGHDGRFRLAGNNKSKLSAVLVVLAEGAVLLENPWATHRLPDQARMKLCHFPWLDISSSIADWQPGDAEQQIAMQRRMIETMDRDRI